MDAPGTVFFAFLILCFEANKSHFLCKTGFGCQIQIHQSLKYNTTSFSQNPNEYFKTMGIYYILWENEN